ncbi:MAG: hypothetical protein CMJ58_15595 [Planctomycetaceae bacterium]|nr:hypothetical protein [Planctomycetaceae bacterium]
MAAPSHNAAHAPQRTASLPPLAGPFVLVAATVLAMHVLVLRPAQQQSADLAWRCEQLSSAVEKLAADPGRLKQSTALLDQLKQQGRRVAAAEESLARLDVLQTRLAARAESLEAAIATVERLDLARQRVATQHREQTELLAALRQLGATHGNLIDAQVTIAATEQTLLELEEMNAALVARAHAATAAADHWAALQSELDAEQAGARAARAALESLGSLSAQATEAAADVPAAHEALANLAAVRDRLIDQQGRMAAAADSLHELDRLGENLASASVTLNEVKHFVVDVMLLRPAAVQAVAALEPMVQLAKLGRQAAAVQQQSSVVPTPQGQSAPAMSTDLMYQTLKGAAASLLMF